MADTSVQATHITYWQAQYSIVYMWKQRNTTITYRRCTILSLCLFNDPKELIICVINGKMHSFQLMLINEAAILKPWLGLRQRSSDFLHSNLTSRGVSDDVVGHEFRNSDIWVIIEHKITHYKPCFPQWRNLSCHVCHSRCFRAVWSSPTYLNWMFSGGS